jgi:site-specific recombinase XerD
MSTDLVSISQPMILPAMFADAGEPAIERFLTFFTDSVPNRNTRSAYHRNILRFFAWAEKQRLSLATIKSYHVSAYLSELARDHATPTVKQHLASLRMLFDWLLRGGVVDLNPAATVKASTHRVRKGKTPVLTAQQARLLLDSIDVSTIIGLRDRALIGVMVFSFARVGAALGMLVEDYYQDAGRPWFRLLEKGGKRHDVPAHHSAVIYLEAYMKSAGISKARKTPLFRSVDRTRHLTSRGMHRNDVLRMIKTRAASVGLPAEVCCHTFRATGITAFLENGGNLEQARRIANHESSRTTRLYDRTSECISLDEVERIQI